MTNHSAERILPYSRRQIFDLVADVEHYAEFVPGWLAARVTGKKPLVYHTEQIMGLGPVRLRFHSDTELHPPDRITVTAHGDTVRDMRLLWTFDETGSVDAPGCVVRLEMTLLLSSPRLQKMLAGLEKDMAPKLVDAFDKRARHVYGS